MYNIIKELKEEFKEELTIAHKNIIEIEDEDSTSNLFTQSYNCLINLCYFLININTILSEYCVCWYHKYEFSKQIWTSKIT